MKLGLLAGIHEDVIRLKQAFEILEQAGCEAGGAMDTQDVARATATLAHCEHTVFGSVGHMIHQDRADEYLDALVKFISGSQ